MMKVCALLCVLSLAVSCKSTQTQLPEGWIKTEVHEDYAEFRPVSVALLPVKAKRDAVADTVRDRVYDGLFAKKYSALKPQVVDEHINTAGDFDADGLDWQATLRISIDRWRPLGTGRHIAADGKAEMKHRSGEVLWKIEFRDQPFDGGSADLGKEHVVAAREMAKLILKRLPPKPPLPRE